MKSIETASSLTIQSREEELSALEWDPASMPEPIEDLGFVRTCRFIPYCDGLHNGDGCPTCDFVRGVIQD